MNNESSIMQANRWRAWLGWFAVVSVFVGLAWRQDRFVARYAVNMMFWDQWDFYLPLFRHQGWWEIFTRQHGPHREGVGLLLTSVLARMSGWNSRWDAFGSSDLIIGAAALALGLAWKCGVRAGLALAAVPLIFFNFHQYEDFVGAAHLAHGTAPMLLFMAYCLAWFWREPRARLLAVGGLTFLLVFTGFGIFAGLIAPIIVMVEAAQALRAGDRTRAGFAVLATAIIGAAWMLFLHNYLYVAAAQGLGLPGNRWYEYFLFAALMLANFYGIHGSGMWPSVFGGIILIILTAICVRQARRLLRSGVAGEPRSAAVFSLAAYALIYCANSAFGRAALGLGQAPAASRYVTLMIPAALAIFLEIAALPSRRWAAGLGLAYAALLVPATMILHADERESIQWYSEGRRAWKAAYLATHDEAKADAQANFRIYPGSVADRLEYLEKNRLNLFSSEETTDPRQGGNAGQNAGAFR